MQRVAREEARADLKKKRSANYLTQDFSRARRHSKSGLVRQGNQPTAPFQKENPGEFVKYSQKIDPVSLYLGGRSSFYPYQE